VRLSCEGLAAASKEAGVGFFDRKRNELIERGIDPHRLPPGQYMTDRFPVLHAGEVPIYADLAAWDLRLFGRVARPVTLSYDELLALGVEEVTTDIHCVTKWSKFDTRWSGVPFGRILELVEPLPEAAYVVVHAEYGFTTNLPLADLAGEHVAMLATHYDGAPLEPEHGYPVRFLVPHLYFWKSAKWVRAIEFAERDRPGFWERNGYHNYGDPWREQRYWED